MAARLKETYINEVAPALMKKFEYKSVMQIPKLDKIVVNIACGEARENSKVLDSVVSDLMQITGQRPVMCRAKKSIANFKLREGMVIGAKVTLRGDRMYSPRQRLQRYQPELFRRQRQLFSGYQGTADIPRDRVRQD